MPVRALRHWAFGGDVENASGHADETRSDAVAAPSLSPSTNAKQRCMYPNVATCTLARRSIVN